MSFKHSVLSRLFNFKYDNFEGQYISSKEKG